MNAIDKRDREKFVKIGYWKVKIWLLEIKNKTKLKRRAIKQNWGNFPEYKKRTFLNKYQKSWHIQLGNHTTNRHSREQRNV